MAYETLIQPIPQTSLADAMQQWGAIRGQQQEQSLRQMAIDEQSKGLPSKIKLQEAQANHYQAQAQQEETKAQAQKFELSGNMARTLMERYSQELSKTGIPDGSPQSTELFNQIGSPFAQQFAKLHGVPYDPSQPINRQQVEAMATYQAKAAQQYHPPVGTNQGTLQYGANGWEPIQINGQTAMPVGADVNLHAQLAAAKAGQQAHLVEGEDGDHTLMPAYQANPNFQNLIANNPGNMRPPGQSSGFQQFNSPEEGLQAMDANLQNYHKQGINTLAGVISKWSPPNENDTNALISNASQRLGIHPQQPIDLSNPVQRHAIISAIAQQENPIFKPIRGQTTKQKEAAIIEAKNEGDVKKQQIERQFNADNANTILDRAVPLLDVSTASGAGALVDSAMKFLGKSTPSADAAEALKVLGARLTLLMPKMSGPQSDRDVQLYKEEAGILGDPTVPVSRKRMAMKEIRALNDKYGTPSEQKPNKSSGLSTEDLLKKYGAK